jgi:ABC-type nitrate/sulfonate/bicarbonate transport system substrate-binding protein
MSLSLSSLGIVASSGPSSAAPLKPEVSTLKYEAFAGYMNLPEVAVALGDLTQLRLVNLGGTANGPQQIESVSANDIQFAQSFNGGVVQAAANGVNVTSIINYEGDLPPAAGALVTSAKSGITSAKDLAGKPVAFIPGTQPATLVDTYLKKAGLSQSSVTAVSLSGAAELAALENGSVSAGAVFGPYVQAAKAAGLKELTNEDTLYGPQGTGSIIFANSFIKANPKTVKIFVTGLAKAIIWIQNHTNRQLITKYSAWLDSQGRSSDAQAFASFAGTGIPTKGGVMEPKDMSTFVNWLVDIGQLKKGQIKIGSLYTNKFNPYAKSSS